MTHIEPTEAHVKRAIGMLPGVFPHSNQVVRVACLIAELDAEKAAHDADKQAFSEVAKQIDHHAKHEALPASSALRRDFTAIRDLIVPFILPDPEPVDPLVELINAADALSFAAQSSGGTAGRDDGLVAAIDRYAASRAMLEIREAGK